MSLFRRTVATALVAVGAPALAAAQAFAGTGLAANTVGGLDQRWQVKCTIIALSVSNAACDGAWKQASIVTAAPGGWASVPGPGGTRYISLVPSGSVGNSSGETPRYE